MWFDLAKYLGSTAFITALFAWAVNRWLDLLQERDKQMSAETLAKFKSELTVLAAQRTAFQTALGQRAAERRIELIEEVALCVSESGDWMDGAIGGSGPGEPRPLKKIAAEFERLLALTDLYLSDDVGTALKPIRSWLWHVMEDGNPASGQPNHEEYKTARRVLSEAIHGQHLRS